MAATKKTTKKNLAGYFACKARILEQIGQLKALVEAGEINPHTMDRSSLFDYVDCGIVGNLMNSPVWANTLASWFFAEYDSEDSDEDLEAARWEYYGAA